MHTPPRAPAHARAKPALAFVAAILPVFVFAADCGKPEASPMTTKAATIMHEVASDDFSQGLDKWVVEQMPGGTVTAKNGVLTINDKKGCTVWLRQKLTAPVMISYEVTMSPDTRVSDMNCFWMASDPKNPGDLFYKGYSRTGKFSGYDSLHTYYVGYGGNDNTSTRFRRYDGTVDRLLLPENDRAGAEYLLKPGRVYKITLIAQNGEARFLRDSETVFRYVDPAPLTEGWFGFRTVNSKMMIRNFRITKPE